MIAIRKHAKEFLAVIGLIAVAVGVSLYLLNEQRMRFPWEAAPLRVNAEFSTAQAVTAGQGQTVRVSGVRIGDIGAVKLKDGKAVVEMVIDPEYKGLVRQDAHALLRPRTGLKDMFIDLEPGTDKAPAADAGYTIPISATSPDVNPDEILGELDSDTRDYLKLLIGDAGRGLDGRGGDLREVLRRFEPTHRDLARVNSAVATRRQNLRHLITSLNTLNGELAKRSDDLAGLVNSSSAVMNEGASEEANISSAVGELPGALRQTTDTMTRVQRYATLEDLDRFETTIEEREEYEPHISSGTIIYAGVDYADILAQAQAECDVLLWDGGNNDLPFYRPTVSIVVADPLRAGHETTYFPGETNFRMADVIVVNKVDSAGAEQLASLDATIASINPNATVVRANSRVTVDEPDAITGKRVLVIEDGPTLTHGEMKYGAGVVAANQHGAAEIVDPRPWAVGTIDETFRKYDVGPVLPAMGYSEGQLAEMEKIIDAADVDLVVIGTPIDLRRVITISKPAVRVRYDLDVLPDSPTLTDVLAPVLKG